MDLGFSTGKITKRKFVNAHVHFTIFWEDWKEYSPPRSNSICHRYLTSPQGRKSGQVVSELDSQLQGRGFESNQY